MYLNFFTFWKNLLAESQLRFYPAFCWRDITIRFVFFLSTSASLLSQWTCSVDSMFQVSLQFSVAWVVLKNPSNFKILCHFCNKLFFFFYGEELFAPRPTSRPEEHPFSAVGYCLFNVFAAILHIWRPSTPPYFYLYLYICQRVQWMLTN